MAGNGRIALAMESTTSFGRLEGPVRVREMTVRVAFDGRIIMRSAAAEVSCFYSVLFKNDLMKSGG